MDMLNDMLFGRRRATNATSMGSGSKIWPRPPYPERIWASYRRPWSKAAGAGGVSGLGKGWNWFDWVKKRSLGSPSVEAPSAPGGSAPPPGGGRGMPLTSGSARPRGGKGYVKFLYDPYDPYGVRLRRLGQAAGSFAIGAAAVGAGTLYLMSGISSYAQSLRRGPIVHTALMRNPGQIGQYHNLGVDPFAGVRFSARRRRLMP